MEWTKLTAACKTADLDTVAAVMSMLDNGLMIEDYSDVTTDGVYGDLIDESILTADREHAAVSIFVPAERSLAEYRAFLAERFSFLSLDVTLSTEGMREEDWAESWKKYYKPIPLGRVTVVPAWQEYTPAEGEAIIRMDPGMAFGTGTHETTRLVMRVMQDFMQGGERVLDIGCGSGILSLCAAKLGASAVEAYDIDPVAVRVARENVATDGAENITCDVSDLLSAVDPTVGYDLVLANIVADVILRLLPDLGRYMKDGAHVIASGIISPRADEVRAALAQYGFTVVEERRENDWLAILAKK